MSNECRSFLYPIICDLFELRNSVLMALFWFTPKTAHLDQAKFFLIKTENVESVKCKKPLCCSDQRDYT